MSVIDEIFEQLQDKDQHLDYSFSSDEDLNNVESMRVFLADYDLENNVYGDDGTLVVLFHDDYDFHVVVESYGGGDFFSHVIVAYQSTDA